MFPFLLTGIVTVTLNFSGFLWKHGEKTAWDMWQTGSQCFLRKKKIGSTTKKLQQHVEKVPFDRPSWIKLLRLSGTTRGKNSHIAVVLFYGFILCWWKSENDELRELPISQCSLTSSLCYTWHCSTSLLQMHNPFVEKKIRNGRATIFVICLKQMSVKMSIMSSQLNHTSMTYICWRWLYYTLFYLIFLLINPPHRECFLNFPGDWGQIKGWVLEFCTKSARLRIVKPFFPPTVTLHLSVEDLMLGLVHFRLSKGLETGTSLIRWKFRLAKASYFDIFDNRPVQPCVAKWVDNIYWHVTDMWFSWYLLKWPLL